MNKTLASLPAVLLSAGLISGCSAPKFLERSSEVVVPGVTYTRFDAEGPNEIHVISVDLRDTNLTIESARLHRLTPTSRIAAAVTRPDAPVVAAVNADFFSFTTGWPVGNQINGGEIVTALPTRRSHFLMTGERRPRFERMEFSGRLTRRSGATFRIDQANQPVPVRGTVFYSLRWDDSIRTDGGRAFWLSPQPPGGFIGKTVWVLDSSGTFSGPSPRHAAIVFGKSAVDSLRPDLPVPGDTLELSLTFLPGVTDVREVTGGAGRLLRDGEPVLEENIAREAVSLEFMERRHPRTFVGMSKDSATLYLCVVDGRQKRSVGMSFREIQEFLVQLGAWQAMNFDGGGSTTMVVKGKILNSPSDKTGERPVANALVVRRRNTTE